MYWFLIYCWIACVYPVSFCSSLLCHLWLLCFNCLLPLALALEVAEKSQSVTREFDVLQSANFFHQEWFFCRPHPVQDKCMKEHFFCGIRCVIISLQALNSKVNAADPLRGEPVCLSLSFSFFLFSFLAHVTSLPLSALRLWWVKDKWDFSCRVLPFVWSFFKLCNDPSCCKALQSALCDVFLRALVWTCTHMHGHTHTNISSPIFQNVLTNTRKINFFSWMLSAFPQPIDAHRGFFSDWTFSRKSFN